MQTEKIKTISGKELLDMNLPAIHFVVKGLVAQGLNIVSGMSKIGKSWMLLLMCLKVAEGKPFWNYETEKGTVLYLCLEDSYNRINVSNFLGHSDLSTTANIYAHLDKSSKQISADIMGEIINGTSD